MAENMNIHWFRQDLRISDNPALVAAAKAGNVLPVYILEDDDAKEHAIGAASRWWLYHSLQSLNRSLGGGLLVARGAAETILLELIRAYDVHAVYWNRCYEPWRMTRDTRLQALLQDHAVEVHSFNGSLLWEPWEVLKRDGKPYKVFTPFYRKGCLQAKAPREPLAKPSLSLAAPHARSMTIDGLGLLPSVRWDRKMEPYWHIGEEGAEKRLGHFLDTGLDDYKEGRNFPYKQHVSRLSPHLHFGEISPNQVWYAARMQGDSENIDHFCRELGWREFSHSLLYYFPDLPDKNLNKAFDAFPWQDDKEALKCWQQGQTGYPIVDAGMRELWQTGYIHNRVRMIVGSFLVKNLLLHWHHGEAWFWDCLVDADLANNSAGWQWVAGCGADAAPYFRVFNPVTQGQKFDTDGDYTRHYVPELRDMPNKYLFNPWDAPEEVLQEAGVTLGRNYPMPIVDVKASREHALEAFASIRKNAA